MKWCYDVSEQNRRDVSRTNSVRTRRVVKSEASPTRMPPKSLVPALLKNSFLYVLPKGSFHVIEETSSSSWLHRRRHKSFESKNSYNAHVLSAEAPIYVEQPSPSLFSTSFDTIQYSTKSYPNPNPNPNSDGGGDGVLSIVLMRNYSFLQDTLVFSICRSHPSRSLRGS